MKKVFYISVILGLFFIFLGIFLYNIDNDQKKIGKVYKPLYDSLEYNIKAIETNMDEITTSNKKGKWLKLKEINIKDELLINTYNLLISDIRTCYSSANDSTNEENPNIKIMNLKNNLYVTENELAELNKNNNCLEVFEKYKIASLSNNQKLSQKIQKQIMIIIDYNPSYNTYKTFDDLIYDQLVTMSKISSLTKWLKAEYYSYKN